MKNNIVYKTLRGIYKTIEEEYIYLTNPKPNVLSVYDTIDYIIKTNCSVARLGDGEFAILTMAGNLGFQHKDEKLSKRLKEVLDSKEEKLLICIPDIFDKKEYKNRTKDNKKWWKNYMQTYRKVWYQNIDFYRTYGATNFTRYYITRKDKSDCANYFNSVREIWKNKDIIFIEGEKTRCGVGNDLFNNAKSIQRIIAPAESAFDRYDEILAEAKKVSKDKLILLALGPTATVLAHDLAIDGHRAIDIGHMDVEYEWFLRKAEDRINLENKYVNESKDNTFSENFYDKEYNSQIIKKIM